MQSTGEIIQSFFIFFSKFQLPISMFGFSMKTCITTSTNKRIIGLVDLKIKPVILRNIVNFQLHVNLYLYKALKS